MGVRLETEKQSAVITEILRSSDDESAKETLSNLKLKAFVGHSGRQVFAGTMVGFIVATLLYFLVF